MTQPEQSGSNIPPYLHNSLSGGAARPAPTAGAVAGRIVVIVIATVIGWASAFVTAFGALIVGSGCFIECTGSDSGNTFGAFLLLIVAVEFAAAPIVLAVALVKRSRTWTKVAAIACALPLALPFLRDVLGLVLS